MKNIEYRIDLPIKDLTTYKTEGVLPLVFFPKSVKECITLTQKLEYFNLPYFVIGNGSNLLISPKTRKICINLSKMREKIIIKDNLLTVSAQTPLAKVYLACKDAGLSGIEKACTIPARVGGFVKNNASFMEQAAFDHLEKLTMLIDGKIKTLKKSQCIFSYRHTLLPKGIILSATFSLTKASSAEVAKNYQEAILYRNTIQPKGFSCGCVFKNPEGKSAGQLIEKCNLKGKKKGDAIISEKHGNFIINSGSATFDDINHLIEFCEEEVYRKFGIKLEREVELII